MKKTFTPEQQAVVDQSEELDRSLTKLLESLSGEAFQHSPQDEQKDVREQAGAMRGLLNIMQRRIERFGR